MLSDTDYVRQSLELNLFFLRIAKEHTFFLQAALTPRDISLAQQAECLRDEFTQLLSDAIVLADGVVSPEIFFSGELFTQYTLEAERASEFYTGLPLDTELTQREISIGRLTNPSCNPMLVNQVSSLNERACAATSALADYKSKLLQDVLSCKTFTMNYPLLIDHILREARFYLKMLTRLQNRISGNFIQDIIEQEAFWNQIMGEHAKFIRGLLDPSEEQLFDIAHDFGKQFDELTREAKALTPETTQLPLVSSRSYKATYDLRNFKTAGTKGLLECTIKAIAVPLLGDHVIREANHYLRVLNTFNRSLH